MTRAEFCADGVQEGYYLTCEVATDADGNVAITRLQALRPFRGEGWMAVTRDELDRIDPERVWFQRNAKVIHSESFPSTCPRPSRAEQSSEDVASRCSSSSWSRSRTDPELVNPRPPPGVTGCCWIIPGGRVLCTCCTAWSAAAGGAGRNASRSPAKPLATTRATDYRLVMDLTDPGVRDAVTARLGELYAGRPVILGPGVLAGFTPYVAWLRELGCRTLVLSTARGAGPVPGPGECVVVEVSRRPPR